MSDRRVRLAPRSLTPAQARSLITTETDPQDTFHHDPQFAETHGELRPAGYEARRDAALPALIDACFGRLAGRMAARD